MRWQIGTMASFAMMILGDILTYIPIIFVAVKGFTGSTMTTDDLVIFWVSLVLTWGFQFTAHLVPAVVTMAFLEM